MNIENWPMVVQQINQLLTTVLMKEHLKLSLKLKNQYIRHLNKYEVSLIRLN